MESCSYEDIQTPPDVWQKILELCPVPEDAVFYEPFKGEGSLYNQITNKKYWTEITEGKDVFDFENKNEVTCIYTNPPFKSSIPNKNGIKSYKNCVAYFLEYFTKEYPNLDTIGFLINTKSFVSLTPKRLKKIEQNGFTIAEMVIMNMNYWYGSYQFIVFKKNQTNKLVKVIEKTFTKK